MNNPASTEMIEDNKTIADSNRNALADIARFVLALRMRVAGNPHAENPYPVMGAAGPDFFLEISDGMLRDRRIFTTVYITLGNEFTETIPPTSGWGGEIPDEIQIGLPDASHVVALTGLLEKALGTRAAILHPLTRFGNFPDGWGDALAVVTV